MAQPNGNTRTKPPRLLDHVGASKIIGYSPTTLAVPGFREKHGIPHLKIGGLVRYEEEQLLAWRRTKRQHECAV